MRVTIFVLLVMSVGTILLTGFWDVASTKVLPNTQWGLYNRDFFENLLVEIHGGIIDLLVVGIILYWFDNRKNKKEEINKVKKELSDLKFYVGSDISYRFYVSVQHLLSLGVKNISIPDGDLSNLKIEYLSLTDSNLIAVNFSRSTLNEVKLKNCNAEATCFFESKLQKCNFTSVKLNRAKFINTELNGHDFRRCEIRGATFKNCNLKSANFSGVDCSGVDFKGSNLRSANFKDALNLTKEMILSARDYKYIKLPENLNL